MFVSGRSAPHSSRHEPKHVVSACWACTQGSKVVIGYSNGDLFLWAIPFNSNQKNAPAKNKHEINAVPNIPLLKLNLGFKMDKIPIVSLRWVAGDGKTSRIYINGFFDDDTYLFQVRINSIIPNYEMIFFVSSFIVFIFFTLQLSQCRY